MFGEGLNRKKKKDKGNFGEMKIYNFVIIVMNMDCLMPQKSRNIH